MNDDPSQWTIRTLRRKIDQGHVAVAEVYERLAELAERVRHLNCIAGELRLSPPAAGSPRDDPRSRPPLHHIPLLVKDSIDTADAPTTAGTGALAGCVPSTDAAAVARLRAAGAVVAGKATMHELSYGVTSDNAVTGTVRNPYDPSLIPGGSSGGTAVAVATGIVPAGLGADTGGSVRLPAALCGVVGFRPTVGRYPGGGVVPLSHTRDTIGPMARSVDDVRRLDSVLADEPSHPVHTEEIAGVRLGVPVQFFDDLDHDVDQVVRAALDALADAGATLIEVNLDDALAEAAIASPTLLAYEMQRDLRAYLDSHGYRLTLEELRAGIGSPDVRRLWDLNGTVRAASDTEYQEALLARGRGRNRYRRLLDEHRVAALVQPTAPLVARPVEESRHVELRGRRVSTFATYIRHTDLAGTLGLPGISLPAGMTEAGLPVGLELDAGPHDDAGLLALAETVEALLPPRVAPTVE